MIEPSCLVCCRELKELHDPVSGEKLKLEGLYHTPCCRRIVCPECLAKNNRLSEYCPLCLQVRELSSKEEKFLNLLDRELYNPPPYEELPQYDGKDKYTDTKEKTEFADNGIHYVKPGDSLCSIALQYGIEISELKKANRLFDNNVIARRYVVIPGYFGPVESEPTLEEELKASVKRFQLLSKCIDPNEAKYYMATNGYSMESALRAYQVDLQWERDHPYDKSKFLSKNQDTSRTSTHSEPSTSKIKEKIEHQKSKKWFNLRF